MKFKNLDILYDAGRLELSVIENVENILNIHFPKRYIELMHYHNDISLKNNSFLYYDSSRDEEGIGEVSFDGFSTENYEASQDIIKQYICDDPIYGYEHVYSFGSTGEGNFICFDYREDPAGDEPKICIVIHDEYDDETGKMLLFPVANNFEEFLDSLKSFDEIMAKYSEE